MTVIPVAHKTGRFKIINYANAFAIKNDGKNGQSVLYYDSMGRVQEQPADVIVLGAFVFNNVRLLLNSKLGKPYDPVTDTGVVGKNYAYQTGGGGATRLVRATRSSSATWAPVRLRSRSTTSTPTTSTTPASASSAAARSPSARAAPGRSRASASRRARRAFGSEWKAAIQKYYKQRRQRRVPGRVARLPVSTSWTSIRTTATSSGNPLAPHHVRLGAERAGDDRLRRARRRCRSCGR